MEKMNIFPLNICKEHLPPGIFSRIFTPENLWLTEWNVVFASNVVLIYIEYLYIERNKTIDKIFLKCAESEFYKVCARK